MASSLLTILCLSLSMGLNASDQTTTDPKPKDTNEQPGRFNKATGIVGMPVVNPAGERLGQIKDVVFDLKSERIAYAVLATTTTPEKLLAVPIAALNPNTDGEQLILRADRSKLETAKGFAANNWPPAVNPVWGAQPYASAQPAPRVSLPHR